MGLFSRFERRVEDGFEGMNEKLFDAPISPVQITKKAEKQMRREKMVGAGKEYAPTLYTVLVNPDDDHRLFGLYPTLAGETETYLRAKAHEEGLVMDGAPLVRFMVDDELGHGKFDVIAEIVSAPIVAQLRNEELERYGLAPQPAYNTPAAQRPQPYTERAPQNEPYASAAPLAEAAVNAPVNNTRQAASVAEPIPISNTVMFDQQVARNAEATASLINVTTNRSFALANSRVLIGRATNCDIVLDDLNASRTHAEIFRESPNVWGLADLGSTNGTLVNGKHIASVLLSDGDRITIGTTTFVFTLQ
jgi:pSer/pThr/pTyr-binding forkhead associated (FHA) protein